MKLALDRLEDVPDVPVELLPSSLVSAPLPLPLRPPPLLPLDASLDPCLLLPVRCEDRRIDGCCFCCCCPYGDGEGMDAAFL